MHGLALATWFGWARHARARPRGRVARQVVEMEAPSMRFAPTGMRNMHTLTRLPRRGVSAAVGKYSWRFMLKEGCS